MGVMATTFAVWRRGATLPSVPAGGYANDVKPTTATSAVAPPAVLSEPGAALPTGEHRGYAVLVRAEAVGWRLLLAAVTAAAGCAAVLPQRVERPADDDSSFVFFYFDTSDCPSAVRSATLRQVAPPTDKPFVVMRVDGTVFYREGVRNGAYALTSFSSAGVGGWVFGTPTVYGVPRQGSPVRFVIERPGVYFGGAFAYRKAGGGFLAPQEFELVPLEQVTEKETLQRILPHVRGTPWETRVMAHYEKLP